MLATIVLYECSCAHLTRKAHKEVLDKNICISCECNNKNQWDGTQTKCMHFSHFSWVHSMPKVGKCMHLNCVMSQQLVVWVLFTPLKISYSCSYQHLYNSG